ncbi:MAG: leucine-rich repeat domain-containing protein [Christensenellales bacterium]
MKKKILLVLCMIMLLIMSTALAVACSNKDKTPTDNDDEIIGDGGNGGDNGGDNGNGNSPSIQLVNISQYLTYELNEDGNSYAVTGLTDEGYALAKDEELQEGESLDDIEALCKLIIPDNYQDKPVTVIKGLTLPNDITGAFYNCNLIARVLLPNTIKSIGTGAFHGCSSLKSIFIPDSVTSIGNSAFRGCSSLASIDVQEGNTTYHSDGNCLIETESGTLILGCSNSVIPTDDSVTSIGSHAFSDCSNLTSITIPDSVTYIGSYAFSGCSNLTSIEFLGTKTQWESVAKVDGWNQGVGVFNINCEDGEYVETVYVNDVIDKVITGYALAVGEDSAFSAFNLATNIAVSTQEEGYAAKNYTIDFKLSLDLVNSLATGKGANGIVIDIKEDGNQAFYFNYKNDYANGYEYYNGRAFMQVGDQKFNIKAVDVAKTVKEQFTKAGIAINPDNPTGVDEMGNPIYNNGNPYIDDEAIAAVAEQIGAYLRISAILASNPTLSDDACSFEINLGAILDPTSDIGAMLAGLGPYVNPYFDALGIDLELGELSTILPALAIKFDFTFDDNGMVKTAKAELVIPAKHVVVKNTNGGDLLDITIPNKLTASVDVESLVVNGDDFSLPMVKTSVATGAKEINMYDRSITAKINVKKAINMNVAGVVNLDIPAHEYTLKADISIDPTALIGVDFTDAIGNFAIGNLLDALLGSDTLDPAIDFINIAMTYVEDDVEKTLLSVKLDTLVGMVEVDLDALGMGSIKYNDLDTFKNFIIGTITGGEGEATIGEEESGPVQENLDYLKPIGNTLKNLQVKIDANGLDVTFAKTKFAIGFTEGTDPTVKYDINKQYLEVGATAKVTAEGIKITATVANGGERVQPADMFDIDVEVEIKFADIKYGEAVRPTFA